MNIDVLVSHAAATRGTIRATPPAPMGMENFSAPCALGRSGVIAAADKREGDGATPLGTWPLRKVYYRMDRIAPPETAGLPVEPISADLGWCDAAEHPDYNRPVPLPGAASHEELSRTEPVYDLVVVLGHNDDPVVPGMGSAIFWHLARADWQPTAGCIATRPDVLSELLAACGPDSTMTIRLEEAG